MAGEMTCPARFCMDRLGALATTVSPVSFKPPQNDNIPLHGRRWKAIAKMTVENLRAASSPVRWTSCTKYFFFFLKRTMIISELRALWDVDVFQGMYNLQFVCVTVIIIQ